MAIKLVNQPCLSKGGRDEREKRKGEDWGEDTLKLEPDLPAGEGPAEGLFGEPTDVFQEAWRAAPATQIARLCGQGGGCCSATALPHLHPFPVTQGPAHVNLGSAVMES